jgi:hypothetical protein
LIMMGSVSSCWSIEVELRVRFLLNWIRHFLKLGDIISDDRNQFWLRLFEIVLLISRLKDIIILRLLIRVLRYSVFLRVDVYRLVRLIERRGRHEMPSLFLSDGGELFVLVRISAIWVLVHIATREKAV